MHIDNVKKFCLDVRANPWRTEVVQQRFREHNLDVEFFYGAHGQTIGIMPCRTVFDVERDHTYRINPGKTSITLSKIMLFQHILDKGYEEVLIFENDVNLVQYFRDEFEKSYAALPEGWQAVHVGFCCSEGKPQTVINDRITQIAGVLCCHALLLKHEAVQLAYDTLLKSDWGTPSDTILQRRVYPKLQHYCFVPQLAFQDGTDSEAAKMEVWSDIQGWTSPCMLRIFDEQLTGFGDGKAKFAEVGCWKGRSTAYIADEIKRRLKNVTLYAIDTWEGNADEPDMQAYIAEANAKGGLYQEFIRNMNRCGVMDYVTPMRMKSVEAAAKFADGELSFAFIDAGHSYEDVSADLRAYGPKVHFNSVMAGHDIARASVRRAVEDYCRETGKKFRTYQECWIIDHMHIKDF